jgi:hypothetical protein
MPTGNSCRALCGKVRDSLRGLLFRAASGGFRRTEAISPGISRYCTVGMKPALIQAKLLGGS